MQLARRLVLAGLAVVLCIAGPTAPASADHTFDTHVDYLSGSILLPTRFVGTNPPNADGAYPGLARRVYLASWDLNGLVGYAFDVHPDSLGGRFELELAPGSDTTGMADLGIYFYTDMGDVGSLVTALSGTPVTSAEYDFRRGATDRSGESGAIPAQASKAVVFMKAGLNETFTYKAYGPAGVHVSATGLSPPSLTILAGSRVVWQNTDTGPHTVTADMRVDLDGSFGICFDEEVDRGADPDDAAVTCDPYLQPLFDSSPNTATQPMVEGATFSYTFMESGIYTYTDKVSLKTGTIIVEGEFGTPA